MRFVVAIAALLWVGVAQAQGFSYKGLKLGDSVSAVREKLPTYRCTATYCEYSMPQCVSATASSTRKACDASASFGGAWVNTGFIQLHEGKVSDILITFTQEALAEAVEAAVQAYGQPSSTESVEVQARGCAKVPSWTKRWGGKDDRLVMVQRFVDINTGAAQITNSASRERFEQGRKDRAAKGSRDF